MQSFSEFVCKQFGSLRDRYILQGTTPNGKFCSFDSSKILELVVDSDTEDGIAEMAELHKKSPKRGESTEKLYGIRERIDNKYGSFDNKEWTIAIRLYSCWI